MKLFWHPQAPLLTSVVKPQSQKYGSLKSYIFSFKNEF